MPRKATRASKKKTTAGLSKSSVQKIDAIAQKTEEETFADLINDFDLQAEKLKKQTIRLFANEAKKMLQFLPQKSSIAKEILKMSAYEFKERGGTLSAVAESWRSGVQVDKPSVQQPPPSMTKSAVNKENKSKLDAIDPAFVTPAFSTRSKALTTGTTSKRQPKPLEQVALSVHSTDSGSPVDEDVFLKLKLGQVVENYEYEILEAASAFPQKWRSHLQKVLKNTRIRMKSQVEEQCFQTPALPR